MQTDRRTAIKAAALGAAATMAGPAAAAAAPSAKIVHHVFFWLKNPGNTADRDAIVAGLRALAGIPVIRSLQIGIPAATEARDVIDASYDVSELMVFDSLADQKTYQDHPDHQKFIATCGPLWRKVVVYDMQTV